MSEEVSKRPDPKVTATFTHEITQAMVEALRQLERKTATKKKV
jgi:hypothetical protein